MKRYAILIFASLMAFSVHAALSVSSLKEQGWVGEKTDGYLGFVKSNVPTDIQSYVKKANQKRNKIYQDIAAERKISLKQVEKISGDQNIKETKKGQYIQNKKGQWVIK